MSKCYTVNNIIILDEDPKKAAKALVRIHVTFYIPLLQKIFIRYHNGNFTKRSISHMWISYMKRSKQNYSWVVEFYEALQEIFKNSISRENKYYSDPKIDFYNYYLKIDDTLPLGRQELCVHSHRIDAHKDNKKKFKEFKDSFINSNRIKYLMMNYPEAMFVNSKAPEWYGVVKGNFEFINVIDNMIVRLVRNSQGNYKYYCKVGLSDIWEEIKNVPQEMRFIINALVYTNKGVNKNKVNKKLKDSIYKIDKMLSENYKEADNE